MSTLAAALLVATAVLLALGIAGEIRVRRARRAMEAQTARLASLESGLRNVSAVAQIARATSAITDEGRLLHAIVQATCGLLETREGVLMLHDSETGSLFPNAWYGIGVDQGPGELSMETGPIAGITRRLHAATLERGPGGAPGGLAVPLLAQEEIIGILWVGGRGGAFSDLDRRLLEVIGAQSGIAISNLRALGKSQESIERLAETDRLKSDFMASITHELKTPLTSLLGYATLVKRRGDRLSQEQRSEYFDVIERQGERMLHLIDELLQSSRIDAVGIERFRRERIDLKTIIETATEEHRASARDHVLSVSVPVGDFGLYGDPTAIEHMISNLLDNALKYSAPGTNVTITVEDQGPEVRVAVADEGIGIRPDDIPYVFERFRQATGRGKRSVGLGLYIVRRLVEAHGGQVWVDSEPDRGSTFTFTLPRRRDREEPAADADAMPLSATDPIDFPA